MPRRRECPIPGAAAPAQPRVLRARGAGRPGPNCAGRATRRHWGRCRAWGALGSTRHKEQPRAACRRRRVASTAARPPPTRRRRRRRSPGPVPAAGLHFCCEPTPVQKAPTPPPHTGRPSSPSPRPAATRPRPARQATCSHAAMDPGPQVGQPPGAGGSSGGRAGGGGAREAGASARARAACRRRAQRPGTRTPSPPAHPPPCPLRAGPLLRRLRVGLR